MTIIYGLREIGTEEIRYVGLTNLSLKAKIKDHKGKARRGWHYGPSFWIAETGEDKIEIVSLRICPRKDSHAVERQWVERLHYAGNRLLNKHLMPRKAPERAA